MKWTILAALALAGCASKEPGIEVRTVEVPVLRVEQCLAKEDIPQRPAGLGKRPTNDARVLVEILLAKVLELQSYAEKADAVMKGCAK